MDKRAKKLKKQRRAVREAYKKKYVKPTKKRKDYAKKALIIAACVALTFGGIGLWL